MNTQNLKVFAERLRTHLESHNLIIKHGQALDLIAAIPGLRNWPEVIAFPARYANLQLEQSTVERLTKRIAKLHALRLSVDQLCQVLNPSPVSILTVWPNGPVPGLYVTTSPKAIDAAIAKYETATAGALLYAESAGSSSDSAIDLGESGLFSPGMDRLPSGTLLVIGPLPLTQESWSDNKDRLNVAAGLVYESSLRVIVLVETPLPENLHSDFALLLSPDNKIDSLQMDVLGVATESGDLQVVEPFVQRRLIPAKIQNFITTQRIPEVLETTLKQAVTKRPYGIIALGYSHDADSSVARLEALLPLTEIVGSAARIQPTFRLGYSKNGSPLSPHFEGIPIFPSIESAYAHGYRRIVIESPYHGAIEAMVEYADKVCFLIPSYENHIEGILINTLSGRLDKNNRLSLINAILCIADITTDTEIHVVCEAFVGSASAQIPDDSYDKFWEYIKSHRSVRWEDQLTELLAANKVTPKQAMKSLRLSSLKPYLTSTTV